ncbi:MAG TPA: hypothetical protein VGK33_11365 [Chloroflexota bacterium]
MRLAEALQETATATLRRVAVAHGLPLDDGTTRDELIARIADRFADPSYLEDQLRRLTDDERSVLASARSSGGELRGLLVDSEHPGTAEHLADLGWLYRVFAAVGPLRGEVYVIPEELLDLLPAEPAPAGLLAGASAPGEARWSDPAFSLMALVSALTRPGGNLETEVRAWSAEPGGWAWDVRWKFFQHLALGVGWLMHRADGSLAPAPALPRWLDDPRTLADRAWRVYLRDRSWPELAHAGLRDVPEADRESADLVDTSGLRRAIVEVVVEAMPEGGWLRLDALSSWLRATRPTLVREQLSPRGLVLLQGADWSRVEHVLLRFFVLGPLYWLGVVAASRDGELISRRPRSPAGPAEACRWDATGGSAAELVAPANAALGALLRAERYLVLRERARLSRYGLVQSHVAAALAAGGSIGECRQVLRELTRADLPEAVDERLSAWDQRFGALTIRPAVVLEGHSAAEVEAVTADEHVRPFVRGRLSPTVVEVTAAEAVELAAALRSIGHLPRVDAALRLAAEPKGAYAGLVDEQVLEFLLVSLLAFEVAWPERLAELEGATGLRERLEHQFPSARLAELRTAASRLAGALGSAPPPRRRAARARGGRPAGTRRAREKL